MIQKLITEEQERLAAEKEANGDIEEAGPSPTGSPLPSKGKSKSPR